MGEIGKAIVFGIVQGFTEWLPISSTGHMILLEEFLAFSFDKAFTDTFFVVTQLGSILAVVILYFRRLWPFGGGKSRREKADIWGLWLRTLTAVIPAGVVGVLFEDWIDRYLFNSRVVAAALIFYGVLFLILERRPRRAKIRSLRELSYPAALLIGVFQVLALVPGTSRSGATILGGVFLGCARPVAAEFSFFLAIPVMAGASGLKLLKAGFAFSAAEWLTLAVGCLAAFLVSAAAIKLLLAYIRRHNFRVFGYYRIILGLAVLVYFISIS
ncbi:MAG: undecaprenyl-diphosphate phosphatase [Peptococcaceae bacterium]|nr:undecaprenyl-diphosphate phosphatase [Peptococcaceae bacterium]